MGETGPGRAREAVTVLATDHPTRHLLRIGERDHSLVDLADPTHLGFDYVRRMGDVLDAVAPAGTPLRVVHVGGGGLTLPRYVAATRPSSAQVVLEPDERVTETVREQLPLPRRSGIKVRPVDGIAGLAALRDGWAEVVVLDAFDDGAVPAELVTRAAARDVRRVLAAGGHYLLNLADRAPFAATRDVVAGLREVFGAVMLSAEPATLRGRREGNLLVVVGRGELPLAALRSRAASSPAPYRVLDLAQVSDSFGGGTSRG